MTDVDTLTVSAHSLHVWHFPHMEKPEMVNETIWQWLEETIQL